MQTADQIKLAKEGDEESLGLLLSSFERYLQVLAEVQIGRSLRGKVDASDLVQETFLEAHRSIHRFEGKEPSQFVAWLKAILSARLANTIRRYLGTDARDIRLEQRIKDELEQSSMSFGGLLVDPNSSPSQHVAGVEQTILVTEAISRLPEDYRQVIVLRHVEGMTFPEIARAMAKTVDSVEKLWLRGITQLKKEFARNEHDE